MRTLLICLMLALIPAGATFAQEPNQAFSGVISGSALTNDSWDHWGGGLQVGTEVSIDGGKSLSLRTLYTKWNFGDPELQAVQATAILSWYAGKRWEFYSLMGADAWIDSQQEGVDFLTGVGMSRQVYKAGGDEWLVPFITDVFGEIIFADVNVPSGNLVQLNFGVKFTRPIRK